MFELEAAISLVWSSNYHERPGVPVEALLVGAVLDGNRDLFGRLYDTYAPLVSSILLGRVPRTSVEDLRQDVFLVAFQKLHTLRDRGAFGPWVAMIARNRAIAFYRESRHTEELPEDLATTDSTKDREATEILAIIRSLPDAYKDTLVLRLVEGMTGPEIALRTGLTAGSVRVNLHRGMRLLRHKLASHERLPVQA